MPWEAARVHAGFSTAEKSWLPVPYQHATLAVDRQEEDGSSVLAHYRQTLAFRRQHPMLFDGDLTFLATNEDVLAFTREKNGETLVFVFNLGRTMIELSLPQGLTVKAAMPMPGFNPKSTPTTVTLEAMDVFCGLV